MSPDLINSARKAIRVAHTERESAMAEIRHLDARLERLISRPHRDGIPASPPLKGGLAQAESEKIKSGRPGVWRGLEGFLLVRAVEEIRAENGGYTVARAIRRAIKTDPVLKAHGPVHRVGDRALQARYQQALEYWSLALENELREKLAEVRERHKETCKRIHVLADLIDDMQRP